MRYPPPPQKLALLVQSHTPSVRRMNNLRSLIKISVFCGSVMLALATSAAPPPQHVPVPGGIAVIQLPTAAEGAPTYKGRRVLVATINDERFAVVGIPLFAKPGVHEIRLGDTALTFDVADKVYREQRLTIKNRRQVNPLPEDLERIRNDRAEMDGAFRHFEPAPAVTEFSLPATGPISSPFGLKRFLNDQPRSPHSGLDIAAPEGDPITAPAAGKVVVVGDYFFNGKTVLIDHGQGLITMYCHMSKTSVAVDDRVAEGDLLGEIGETGRVTGAHLHWAVSLNDTRVDPNLFLNNESKAAQTDAGS